MECQINANAIYCWVDTEKEKKGRNPLIISKNGEQKKYKR